MFDGDLEDEDIKGQFREDIRMIICECGKNKEELVDQLLSLHDFALGNGLSQKEWMELVNEVNPKLCSFINFTRPSKIAA